MNNTPSRRSLLGVCAIVGLGAAVLAPTRVGAADAPVDAGSKSHFIFLGMDVSVEYPDGAGQVQGVTRSEVEIDVAGATRTMPLRKLGNLSIALAPKVSSNSVTLTKVQAERAYSPGRDPGRQATINQSRMIDVQAGTANLQQAREDKLNATASAAGNPRSDPGSLAAASAAKEQLSGQQLGILSGSNTLGMDAIRVGEINAGAVGTYDVLEVTFEISSDEVLDDAYAIMVTLVQHPDHPKEPQRVVAFEKLPRIAPKARKVKISQRGLPPGFGFTTYQVHVYAKGREIATNLSSQRASVSRIDAFQYLFFQHVSAHLGEFLPPMLVTDLLETDLRGRVSEKDRNRTVDVTVTADGQVTKVVLGQATSSTANDEFLEKFIRESIFFPSLAAGKPVDGSTTLFLGAFVR